MTKQRQLIYNIVNSTPDHLKVEEIFSEVKKNNSTMVFATVYNSLNYLVENGFIRRIRIPGLPDHFDRNLQPHDHLLCEECGNLIDVPSQEEKLNFFDAKGNYYHKKQVLYYGVCYLCQKKL